MSSKFQVKSRSVDHGTMYIIPFLIANKYSYHIRTMSYHGKEKCLENGWLQQQI